MDDLISRRDALNALGEEPLVWNENTDEWELGKNKQWHEDVEAIKSVPSAQPTLHGYNVKHLELIAMILQKEDLPPERITEALTDIGRIVAIVRNEFEETLRKAVEQCKI